MRVRIGWLLCSLVYVTDEVVGKTVETIRLARALRQDDLARKVGIAQGSVSKLEAGLAILEPEKVAGLASVLRVQPALLAMSLDAVASGCTHFRRRASLKVSDTNQVRAELALRAHVIDRMRDLTAARPTMLTRVVPDAATPARDIAAAIRKHLGVPPGPIDNLFGVIESAGCVVTTMDEPHLAFDAASLWVDDGQFVAIMINGARPGDRMRFTTAHELAHAVMHEIATPTSENEADEFASEFLMPAKQIVGELANLSFDRLGELKTRWKVSMAAIVRRAFDLDVITERRYKSLMIELSKAGYRTSEPLTPPAEDPSAAADMIAELLNSGQSLADIAAAVGLTEPGELADITGYQRQEP